MAYTVTRRRGTNKPDFGKAVLMSLSSSGWSTARQVHTEAMVHLWDIELSMSAVVSRLEMLVSQGLVEKRVNTNGATQFKLKVDIAFH